MHFLFCSIFDPRSIRILIIFYLGFDLYIYQILILVYFEVFYSLIRILSLASVDFQSSFLLNFFRRVFGITSKYR